MSENKRLVWNEVAPQGAKALYGIHHYITTGTDLPNELIHLVFLRVSQISGCRRSTAARTASTCTPGTF
jgi:hypothetical protein